MFTNTHPNAPPDIATHLSRSCDIAVGCHGSAIRNQLEWVNWTSQSLFGTFDHEDSHAQAHPVAAHNGIATRVGRVTRDSVGPCGPDATPTEIPRRGAPDRAVAVLGSTRFGVSQSAAIILRDIGDTTPDPHAEGRRARAAGLEESENPYLWPPGARELWAAGWWGEVG